MRERRRMRPEIGPWQPLPGASRHCMGRPWQSGVGIESVCRERADCASVSASLSWSVACSVYCRCSAFGWCRSAWRCCRSTSPGCAGNGANWWSGGAGEKKTTRGDDRATAGHWRPGPESNRCRRLCRPLRNHSATRPSPLVYIAARTDWSSRPSGRTPAPCGPAWGCLSIAKQSRRTLSPAGAGLITRALKIGDRGSAMTYSEQFAVARRHRSPRRRP